MAGDRYHGQGRHDRDDHRDSRDSNRSSGGRYNKKRKHHGERDGGDDRTSHTMGVGSTLALLKQPELPEFNLIAGENSKAESGGNKDADVHNPQDWEAVQGRPAKKAKKIPKSHSSNYPSITFSSDSRIQSQIKISDLQGLVLYLTADGTSPQWVSVRHRPQIRKVVVLMVPGLEKKDFKLKDSKLAEEDISLDSGEECKKRPRDYDSSPEDYHPKTLLAEKLPSHMRLFSEMFDHLWPVKTPGDDKYSKMHSPLHAMLSAPLPKNQEDKNKKGVKSAREPQGWQNNRTRITEYISSSEDLLENEYTLHPALYDNEADKNALQEQRNLSATSIQHGWVDTVVEKIADSEVAEENIESGSMLAGRKIYAMDCEMCKTGEQEFSLTRISLVNWDGSVELDELVKPDKPIIDYLTQYSGITEDLLSNVTTTLDDIQQRLLKLFTPEVILIGHSLNSDLNALKMTHPFIIDTSLLYPHPRGPPLKSSLKYLAQRYLNKEIQKGHGATGHDPREDARTCLDLVKQKCEKGPQWGTSDSAHENLFKRLARLGVRYKNQGGSAVIAGQLGGKSSAAVDWGDPKKGAGSAANFVIGCSNDDEVVDGVIRAVQGDHDGLEIPGGGVDFVWARMRELEALKGWWNNNKVVAAAAAAANTAEITINEAKMKAQSGTFMGEPSEEPTSVHEPSVNIASIVPSAAFPEPSPVDTVAATTLLGPATEPTSVEDPNHVSPTISALNSLTSRLHKIYSSLPPCTALIIYSGSGDPREMSKLQAMQQTFKREYKVKKWDELSVKWTDVEEQALKRAARQARNGVGFVGVK